MRTLIPIACSLFIVASFAGPGAPGRAHGQALEEMVQDSDRPIEMSAWHGALERLVPRLDSCLVAEDALYELGQSWEQVLASADWDPRAPAPRAWVRRAGPHLRRAFFNRRLSSAARKLALVLLVEVQHQNMRPVYRRMLELDHCPTDWISLAAQGLSLMAHPEDEAAVMRAFVAEVPTDGRAPAPSSWALCAATGRMLRGDAVPPDVAAAVRRLFLFGPQLALQVCMPLLTRLPDAPALAQRVLDGEDWPMAVVGDDPRNHDMLHWYGRGGALVLLGHTGGAEAIPRLAAGLAEDSLMAAPTRDGAVQGLAAQAGPEARALLRRALSDAARRTPRVAHALLRLGDEESAPALLRVALEGSGLVEMRMSAANAYTLLAAGRPGAARRWDRALARAPDLGPPFEALDARMATMVGRLVGAERCTNDDACWAAALHDRDPQVRARAFWQLARRPEFDEDEERALAAVAAETLARTPPNEQHDVVAGAIALLARLDRDLARPWLSVIRRARVAWEGRTNPMGLPFDIPLALAELERRLV
ncbi:MAG: hypothetical protein JRH11_01265 [Deltaproteobacteria bacterium]|nr:hypothetical protein [Deltaproteobacteria bacterium]